MKLLRLLFIFLICVDAYAQQHPIADLRATGSQRYSAEDIIRAAGLEKTKNPVALNAVKEAAERLVASGAFREVGYRHTAVLGGMRVEFQVADADSFVPASFENIVWLPPAELQAEVRKRVPLFQGTLPGKTESNLPDLVATAVQAILAERGVKTRVSVTPKTDADAVTAFLFRADDVTVRIGRFDFTGASPALGQALEIASRESVGKAYDRTSLAAFIQHSLLPVYRSRGYLRAAFGEPDVKVLTQEGNEATLNVSLPVTEGAAYRFDSLTWSGNQVLSTDVLNAYINLQPGQPMNAVQLEQDLGKLRADYGQKGYMNIRVEPQPRFDEANARVRYEIAVSEGELFNMGKLDISGLTRLSADLVRQRWRLREGEPFDPGYVQRYFAENPLPEGVTCAFERSAGEAPNTIDLTLIFCREGKKCTPATMDLIELPNNEPRRRRR